MERRDAIKSAILMASLGLPSISRATDNYSNGDLVILDSFSSLKELESNSSSDIIYIKSTNKKSSYGGGLFRKVNTGHVNDLYGVLSYCGNGFSWVRVSPGGIVYLTDLGGEPNNKDFDNSSVLESALSNGVEVHLGNGTYFCGRKISISSNDFILKGNGKKSSIICFNGSISGGIELDLKENGFFQVTGLSILNDGENKNFDVALKITYGYLKSDNARNNGLRYLKYRDGNRGIIADIDIGYLNEPDKHAFLVGIDIESALNYSIMNITIRGGEICKGKIGIRHRGDGMCVDFRYSHLWMYDLEVGIDIADYNEGFHLEQFEIVNVDFGIRCISQVISSNKNMVRALSWYVTNGHIFAYRCAILCNFLNEAVFSNLVLYLGGNHPVSSCNGIKITTGSMIKINSSDFINLNEKTKTATGIFIGDGYSLHINSINFKAFNNGVVIGENGSFSGVFINGIYSRSSRSGAILNYPSQSKGIRIRDIYNESMENGENSDYLKK